MSLTKVTYSMINGAPINVFDYGAVGNGITDDTAAIQAADAIGFEVVYPPGTYLVNTSTTLTSPVKMLPGAVFLIPSGVTLKFQNELIAGNYVVFSGTGVVDFNEGFRYNNLAWFEGSSLNEKWDFCRRGLLNLYPYIAYVPFPNKGDPGAAFVTSGGRERWYWKLTAPMLFDDPENRGVWRIDGDIVATTAMDAMLLFSPTNKTEDITFDQLGILDANNLAVDCIRINGGARINFPTEIYALNCATAVNVRSVLPISFCEISNIYCGYPSSKVVNIEAVSTAVNGIVFGDVSAAAAQNANVIGINMSGDCRNVRVNSFTYLSDFGSDLLVGVNMEATTAGRPNFGNVVGTIYGQQITTGFKTRNIAGATRITDVEVGPIFSSTSSGAVAVDVEWLGNSTIRCVGFTKNIVLGAQTVAVYVDAPQYNVLTDSGTANIVNNLVKGAYGIGATPTVTAAKLGVTVFNTSDNTVWLKVAETGVAATDFIKLA